MHWKHKIHIFFICLFITAHISYAKTFTETIKQFLSFKVPEHLFSYVNDSIIGKLTAKNVRFVLPNKIEMDDVTLLDGQGARVLHGNQVKLTIALFSLLTDNIRITDAYVDSPFFHYTVIKGVHNVVNLFNTPPTVAAPSTSAKKRRVTIEKINIENGRFQMFHDAGVDIVAEGISAHGSFWVEDGPFGITIDQVNVLEGKIATGGMDLPITKLIARNLWISDEKVSANDLDLL